MANNTAQITSEGTTLERKIFEDILIGVKEKLVLLNLITDVTSFYKPGQKSFQLFQWQNAAAVGSTPEDGTEATDAGIETNSITVLCDQDKFNHIYTHDKAEYQDAVDRVAGFYASAGFIHARTIEAYVAGLMKAAAETSILCMGPSRAGVANAALDQETLEELAIAMDAAKLPSDGRRLIVNSRQKHELIRAFELKDVGKSADTNALRNAFMTRLYGFDIYESVGSTNILSGDTQQAMAFVSDAAFWGLGIAPKVEEERQASKFRTFHSLRSRYGAKANDLPDADGTAMKRVWLVGKGTP